MQTTITFDLNDHPQAEQVVARIRALKKWRRNREAKDLPCGDLDLTIMQLEGYASLLSTARARNYYERRFGLVN